MLAVFVTPLAFAEIVAPVLAETGEVMIVNVVVFNPEGMTTTAGGIAAELELVTATG